MKFPKIEIDINKFYIIGVWCFGIVALMNTMTFVTNIINDNFMYNSIIISAATSLVFNYAIFGFFSYLKSTLPPKDLVQATEEDMFKALKEEKEVEI